MTRYPCRLVCIVALTLGLGCGHEPAANNQGKVEWVDAKSIQPGPVQRESLSDEQMERIRALQATFAEVDPSSLEKWADGFKRDADPDNELQIWEHIANVYREYCRGKQLSVIAKKDVHTLLLLRSMAPSDEVLKQVKLKELSRDEAAAVLKAY